MKLNLFWFLGFFAFFTCLNQSLNAEPLPGSAMPEQVSRALTRIPIGTTSRVLPALTQPKEAPMAVNKAAMKIKFKLNGIILEGNHVYSSATLRMIYQNQLHKTISVAQLFQIVQNITNFYRNNGYIISRAILPPQKVKNGIIRIRIIEGYIGNVSVGGKPCGSKCLVLAFGNQIKKCRPLAIKRMEKYLLLANEIPATTVKAVLAPAKKQIGAADLTLVTEHRPYSGYFSYDNYGTRYIGPQEMTANLALYSALSSGDATQITVTKVPKGKELTYADLNYNFAVDDEGTRWLFGGTRTKTFPLYVLQPLKIDGLTDSYYTVLIFPIIRSRTESLNLHAGFNYVDTRVNTLDELLYVDHIRTFGVGGTYQFSDRWFGANLINLDLRQGLPILGYTSDTSSTAQTSRPGGHADFTKVLLYVNRLQPIKQPWSLYGLITGQYAFEPLLAGEQFAYGGAQLGRGYDVAELLGDRGLAGTLELRYDTSCERILLKFMQLYAFYDAGIVWNIKKVQSVNTQLNATSAGIGSRFFITNYISGNVMWTHPLTKPVAALALTGNGSKPRIFFSVTANLD